MVTKHRPRKESETPPFTILGDNSLGGSYVLRMNVTEAIEVKFGRFKGGKCVPMLPGDYLYIGSAMKGLGRRLLRHATRSDHKPAHPIRSQMLRCFPLIGLTNSELLPPRDKKLHWNIDHLLDLEQVELVHVIAVRSSFPGEAILGKFLQQDPHTFIPAKGLGARDVPGNTHLLGVKADASWWRSLPPRIADLFSD